MSSWRGAWLVSGMGSAHLGNLGGEQGACCGQSRAGVEVLVAGPGGLPLVGDNVVGMRSIFPGSVSF